MVSTTLSALWIGYVLTGTLYVTLFMLFGTQRQQVHYLSLISIHNDYSTHIVRNLLGNSLWIGNSAQSTQFNCNLSDQLNYLATFISIHYGLLAMILFLCAFIGFLSWLIVKSIQQKNQLGSLIAACCSITFLLQFVIWALGNIGVLNFPTFSNDATCPFFYYEGTTCILTYIFLGIIISVVRNKDVLTEEEPEPLQKVTICNS